MYTLGMNFSLVLAPVGHWYEGSVPLTIFISDEIILKEPIIPSSFTQASQIHRVLQLYFIW